MPGPLPKDPAVRQRRNKSATRALMLTQDLPRLRAPKLPERKTKSQNDGKDIDVIVEWHPMAKKFWEEIWHSPMRFEFLRADEPALFRLVALVDAFWKTGLLEVAREIRMLEREFGLTPLSRRRLEWTVAQAEEAKDRHEEKRMKRAVVIDADPRGALDG